MRELAEDKRRTNNIVDEQERLANKYVMKCMFVTMVVYTIVFVLNMTGVFIVEKKLMISAYLPSLAIYVVAWFGARYVLKDKVTLKYFILFSFSLLLTITGIFLTYHAVLVALLPFLYATLYSSKKVMTFVYVLTVISTFFAVYGGYFFGLCDANIALLTVGTLDSHITNGSFNLTEINPNPILSLFLFNVVPRCLIYVAFATICNEICDLLSSRLEKARMSAELEEAKIKAEEANLAKSRFLAKVSHEIRTPINAVMGMNEMIMQESKEENIISYAGDVKHSSLLLLNIVNEILDSTKIESGKMELVMGRYRMAELLRDVYHMIGFKADEKNLTLQFDIDDNLPNGYYGDDKCIRQVLLNILGNAIKYTGKGLVMLKLTGQTDGDRAVLKFAISDTGQGIRQEDLAKIYDEFERFDNEKNYNVEGYGLGMNITRQLLNLMGSELKIESEYGKGSTFSFELLQEIVDDSAIGNFETILQKVTEKTERKRFEAPSAKVLVVDDYKLNLKVFAGLLKPAKIQVTQAESGAQCLELLRKEKYDIIFLDHMMPQMDGVDTFLEMRDGKLCERTPVIMLTANAIVGDREKYLEIGFDDFLSKPILTETLDDMLLHYLPQDKIIFKEDMTHQEIAEEYIQEDKDNKMILRELRKRLPFIDYGSGLRNCNGDIDFYLEVFDDFTKLDVKQQLTEFADKKDFKAYCIHIHGFKNNAYTVGAKELGDLSLKIEAMTKESYNEDVLVMQKELFDKYDEICVQYCAAKCL